MLQLLSELDLKYNVLQIALHFNAFCYRII